MASLGDKITRRVSDTIVVRWSVKKAGALQTGLSGTTTVTVYDEADVSFSTPAVTEPITGIYQASFVPDAAGGWSVTIVETSVPAAETRYYEVAAAVIGDRLPDILSQANIETWAGTGAGTSIETYRLDELVLIAATAPTSGSLIDAQNDAIIDIQGATFNTATDSLEAIRDRGDAAWITATGFATTAEIAVVDGIVDDILTDTADMQPKLGTPSASISADIAAVASDVWEETTAAHVALGSMGKRLSDTFDAAGDILTLATDIDTNVTTLLGRITSTLFTGITSLAQWLGLLAGKQVGDATARTEARATGAGSGTYDETTDSQEALRDNQGSGGLTAQETRDAMKLAPTGGAPGAGSVDEHLDTIESRVDVATSTRATQAQILSDATPFAGANIDALVSDAATPAEVLTQVNAALDTAIAELTQAKPTATPTVRTGLMLLYMALRNRLDVTTSGSPDALKVYDDAGTVIAKKSLTDDGSDYSEAEMETGP